MIPDDAAPPRAKWYHAVWFVLLMLFFVLGPLALPLLWKSNRFPLWAKWALTLLMIVFFAWLTVKAIAIARTIAGQYQSLY